MSGELSDLERQIVQLIADGTTEAADLAEELFLSPSSVRSKLARISRKLAGEERVAWRDLPRLLAQAESEA